MVIGDQVCRQGLSYADIGQDLRDWISFGRLMPRDDAPSQLIDCREFIQFEFLDHLVGAGNVSGLGRQLHETIMTKYP